MIQLVILLCLSTDATACVEKRPTFAEPLFVTSCMMGGQTQAIRILAENPGYELRSWRCEVNVPRQVQS